MGILFPNSSIEDHARLQAYCDRLNAANRAAKKATKQFERSQASRSCADELTMQQLRPEHRRPTRFPRLVWVNPRPPRAA